MSAKQDRPSSAGSIKRNTSKISSQGLIVLPPEPGLVKFESEGISRPNTSGDSARAGSAGRVERSLQLARKKDLEDDIPRRNGCGPHVSGNALGDLKLSKQEERDNQQQAAGQATAKDSESSDSDSSGGANKSPVTSTNGATAEATAPQAPVELKGEFLKAVMDEEYERAKELCQKILLLEPDNKTCSEFHAVICEKMKQDEEDEENDDDDDDDDDDDSDDSDESGDEDQESDEDDEEDDDDDDESDSDNDFTLPPGPINLVMGGLPIRPQNR